MENIKIGEEKVSLTEISREKKVAMVRLLQAYKEEADSATKAQTLSSFQRNHDVIRSLFEDAEVRDPAWQELARLLVLEPEEDAEMMREARRTIEEIFTNDFSKWLEAKKIDKPFSWDVAQKLILSKADFVDRETGPMKVLCDDLPEIFQTIEKEVRNDGIGQILGTIGGKTQEIVRVIESFGPREMRDRIIDSYLELARIFAKESRAYPGLVRKIFELNWQNEEYGMEAVRISLTAYKLPDRDITSAWVKTNYEVNKSSYSVIERNLLAVFRLETKRPGICRFLFKEFGIADFARYPQDLLIRQQEEFESCEHPYGVIITPREDPNGAEYQYVEMYDELYHATEGKFSLRVFECGSRIDVARALLRCEKRYNPPDGSGHRISLAFIAGHGDGNDIFLGQGSEERDRLRPEDLVGKGVKRAGGFFEDDATIILGACQSGRREGIGQRLSKLYGLKVIAPRLDTSMSRIDAINKPDGSWIFQVRYDPFEAVMTYRHGSLQLPRERELPVKKNRASRRMDE